MSIGRNRKFKNPFLKLDTVYIRYNCNIDNLWKHSTYVSNSISATRLKNANLVW